MQVGTVSHPSYGTMTSHGRAIRTPFEEDVMGRQLDERPPLHRALAAATSLKAGSWDSVEALALLAIEAKDLPDGAALHDAAHAAAAGLKAGSWDSVRALACLARADRELGRG
jgi:hypothetical protein